MNRRDSILRSIEKQISQLEDSKNDFDDILSLIKKRHSERKSKTIPLSIFKNDHLSPLESIVKFLKENKKLTYSEISYLLKRNYDPIAITYRNAKRKMPSQLVDRSKILIPTSIFRNKQLSISENLVSFLKDILHMKYNEIASALNRNQRTVWTIYKRSIKKRK
jgi:hypothetical protein